MKLKYNLINVFIVLFFIGNITSIFAKISNSYGGEDDVACTPPRMPKPVTVVNYCGSSTLTKERNLDEVSWFWQSSPNGTSRTSSVKTITRTSGSVYYLRGYHYDRDCWGPARAVYYSIKPLPAMPTATVSSSCGNPTVLTRGNPPGGITWYWQSSATGTSTSNSSKTVTRTSGRVYYLRARNNSTGCWSSTRTINYTIRTSPRLPDPVTVANNCGSSTLTKGRDLDEITWFWQSSPSGTSRSNSSKTITRTSGSVYYLRGYHYDSDCWGPARTVNYSIKPLPGVPTVSVSNQCGRSVLTRGNPPSGITWYWQSSPSGTSRSNSSKIITRTSGSVYYLRARNNSTGCWSSAKTINYSINTSPSVPTAPTVTNNCGSTVLRRGNPPSGVTWYWQSSASGTSTSNPNVSITRTSGSVYYLRARSSAGCWSSARTINYTIKARPQLPAAVTVVNNCGSSTLTKERDLDEITWFWQSSPSGTSRSNSTKTITRTSGSVYYLRGYHYDTDCWGPARTVNYSIKAVPGVPTATVSSSCGSPTILTRGNPPSGVTWYWQNSATGTNTSNSSISIARTSGTVYYLRARNNNSGCWSSAKKINYIVRTLPPMPEPVIVDNKCGKSVLTKGRDLDEITWFWQSSPSGTSRSNSTKTITLTSGNVYFLRGYHYDNDCWGPARTINFNVDCTYEPVVLSNENYVFTRVYQKEMISGDNIQKTTDIIESITYFDGLGRPIQQSQIKASPNEKDIATHIEYDGFGRQAKQYLPFEFDKPHGSYRDVDINSHINSYYLKTYRADFPDVTATAEVNAYSENLYEPSPLNRVVERGAPGASWKANPNSDNDHTIKLNWNTNGNNEVVYFEVAFEGNDTEKPVLQQNGFHAANELFVTVTKDENWAPGSGSLHTNREYRDEFGRVILKRPYASTNFPAEAHDTYYVYDDFGNLTYVIPPKVNVTDGVSGSELSELCYQYRYDSRNRLIEKKIPGKGWEYIVYNKLDQPILTQDANLRKANSGASYDYWLYTKYDAFGRIVYTGKIINNSTRKVLQSRAHAATYKTYETKSTTPFTIEGVQIRYTKEAYPTSMQNIYTINYYDTYEFDVSGLHNPGMVYGKAVSNYTQSLPTGTKVRVLDTNDWITTVTYYDDKGRPIYVATKNEYLNTLDIVENDLDFTGRVLETKSTHTKGSNAPIITIDKFTYDHVGRLLTQTQKINNQETELIVANNYDELGQLVAKDVGGTSTTLSTHGALSGVEGLQTVNYTYNIRGWLKRINDVNTLGNDLFSFAIDYDKGTNPLYNGNISKTIWKTANDNVTRSYDYTYDALSRITSGISNDGRYNLSKVTYDKMGNILTLDRKGHLNEMATSFGDMDKLRYTYDQGNKLLKVTDISNKIYGFKDGVNTNTDFEYDANGNMIADQNKGITGITYNHLDLPETITVNSTTHTGNIAYIYDATGMKLKKIVTEGSSITNTDYAGNYIYKNGTLEFFNHPEGYVEPTMANGSSTITSFEYIYQYKDHLGNIRLSYTDTDNDGTISKDTEIIEEKNYYPFGLEHKGYNYLINGTNHPYGYQSQEEQEELGLNWIQFKWRNHDPALGKFFNIDPLAESYNYQSPYNFAENKVIWARELEGLEAWYTTTGSTNPDNNPLFRPQYGPLSYDYAVSQGYSSYSVSEREVTVNNYNFSDSEIQSLADWNSANGSTINGECLACATRGSELLTNSSAGWNSGSGLNLIGKSVYDLGNVLVGNGVADQISLNQGEETGEIINASTSNGVTENSAFLAGPAGGYHSIIIIHNLPNSSFSIFDQGTGWDVKNETQTGAQYQINNINSVHPNWGSRIWQLFKQETTTEPVLESVESLNPNNELP